MAMILAGEETLVNMHTDGFQFDQQVAALNGGGWVVTWTSSGQDGDGNGIYQQLYGADGAPLGGEMQVNTFIAGSQANQKVTALDGGGWVVTWRSHGQDGSNTGVYQQAYDSSGAAVGVETQVNTYTADSQDFPEITALEGGGWVVNWQSWDQDGDDWGIYQKVYGSAGLVAETRVNTHTADRQASAQVTALDGGRWVVTWTSQGQDGDNWGVYQQLYKADGSMVGVEALVNTFTAGSQAGHKVTALESGGWVVTWMSTSQDGDAGGVYQQRYSLGGKKVGVETQVNTHTADHQYQQEVTALTGGGWVVTWQSVNQDGSDTGIYQQVFNADGTAMGGEALVNTVTMDDQQSQQVIALENGGWVVTWESESQDGSDTGIYMQAFNADGSKAGAEMRVNDFTAGEQFEPQITALENGGWVVSWVSEAQDGSEHGVYQKVFHFNEAPSITSNGGGASAAVQVSENTLAVTAVAANDPEDQTLSYAMIAGGDAFKFDIDTATGALSFRDAPNFETPTDADADNVYEVTVRVSDGDLHDTQTILVTVTDVNEAPTGVSLSKASVAENQKAGTVVGTLGVADPDGDGAAYALTSNPGGFFEIVGNQLRLAKPLDFEAQESHAITVEATDPGGLSMSRSFAIAVEDAIDVVMGTARKDKLEGAGHAEEIRGLAGSDRLGGGAGDDILKGGNGRDMLVGGAGADKLKGGKGKDTASYADAVKKVVASLQDPKKNAGGAKGDGFESIENLTGSKFADKLTGDKKANVLKGGKGGDELSGGKGKDTLVGNKGADELTGGKNADSFVFKSVKDSTNKKKAWDVIDDFSRKQKDVIDLSAIDARSGKGNQAFDFIGDDAFSGRKGELRAVEKANKTFVYGDVDGDGKADLRIELAKAIDLKEGDFLL